MAGAVRVRKIGTRICSFIHLRVSGATAPPITERSLFIEFFLRRYSATLSFDYGAGIDSDCRCLIAGPTSVGDEFAGAAFVLTIRATAWWISQWVRPSQHGANKPTGVYP